MLDFEAYQSIRFDPSKSLWRGQNRKFTVQFFHRGYIYHDRVDIFEVADGKAEPIKYTFMCKGPEPICEWNGHYMPLLPLPWCPLPR